MLENLATRDIFRIFTVLEQVSITVKIKIMKKFKDTSVAKTIKKRWEGKDMETYLKDKSKDFLEKLKKDLDI